LALYATTPKHRIGGVATAQAKLPVYMGLGDDFIDFDEDPALPPGRVVASLPPLPRGCHSIRYMDYTG
jgi:hypothetical protein